MPARRRRSQGENSIKNVFLRSGTPGILLNGSKVSGMNQCTFHDLGAGLQDRRIFEIVEQAYNRHERVLIFVRDSERAASLDRTLWIIKQESFIPHKIFDNSDADPTIPIGIVTAEINPVEARVLVADGHCSLDFACGFDSVHEFVSHASPQLLEASRARYRAYRERQIPMNHLKEPQ
jgi:DNA polymerase III subunit chi